MGISSTLLPAFLFAVVASAQVERENTPALGLTPRSANGGPLSFIPGVLPERRSGNLPVPRLFRRQFDSDYECPSYAPNLCDGFWCAQTCCYDGNGSQCQDDEICYITGCCKLGNLLDCLFGLGGLDTSSIASIPTRTQSTSAPTPTRSKEELQDLVIDVLEDVPDIDKFADLVKDQPALFDLLDPASNYAILAPNNSAMQGNTPTAGEGGAVSPQLALAFVEQNAADAPLAAGPRTLKTSLTDPKYVNLGKGEPARIVSSPLSGSLSLSIAAGMGKSVIFGAKGESFDGGTVNVGEDLFTLPEGLSTTLRGTNGTEFEKFLDTSGQLATLSDSEHVTIFALTDAAFASIGASLTKDTLKQNFLKGAAWYTPDSPNGKKYNTAAGGKIEIEGEGDHRTVNGIKIVGPDTIIKNGVVHYVEDIIPHRDAPSIAVRPSISPFVALLAMVAALVQYYLMA